MQVFHGADSDVQWLQRDLSIYVVNLFDTHQAAKQLGYTRLSLSYLLSKFCNFLPDKKFQLADWRIRFFNVPQMVFNILQKFLFRFSDHFRNN